MPPQPKQNTPRGPLPPPPPKPEPKLSPGSWYLLFLAAIFLDIVQLGADAIGIGLAVNPFIDFAVGGALYLLFFMKGMLDWRLGISVLAAFGVDAGTGGAFPAWTVDIGYAWVITDGAGMLGNIPLIGRTAQKAVQTAAQRKLPTKGNVPPHNAET